MSQPGDAGVAAGVPDFDLPDVILAEMQLDLEGKITSLAHSIAQDKDCDVHYLRETLSIALGALHLSNKCWKHTVEDNIKLSREKDTLAMTVKKLRRNLDKIVETCDGI